MRNAALAVVAAATAAAYGAPYGGKPNAAVVSAFGRQVSKYVKLHKKVEDRLAMRKATNSPEAIVGYEKKLGQAIREARRNAKPSDIFTPEIARDFRLRMRRTVNESGRGIQQSLGRAEPVALTLRVNESYPDLTPLQSTPPSLLQSLPPLPPELDYRIVGRSLILRDVRANLIVDFMPNAIP